MAIDGLQLEAWFTAYPGHATELVREHVMEQEQQTQQKYDVVVCLGGDGTVNEVVNGLLLADSDLPLPAIAVIPTGSANVLAGALGIPRNSYDAARHVAHLIESGATRDISVGLATAEVPESGTEAHRRLFVVNAGAGIDADVIAAMDELRSTGKKAHPARYLRIIFGIWRNLRRHPPQISVRVNGQPAGTDIPVALVSNTNPWTFLGDLPVVTNPKTDITGEFGFFAINSLSGLPGLVAAANLGGALWTLRGLLGVEKHITRIDAAQRIELHSDEPLKFQVDGEYLEEVCNVELTVYPARLRCVAPDANTDRHGFNTSVVTKPLPYRLAAMGLSRFRAKFNR